MKQALYMYIQEPPHMVNYYTVVSCKYAPDFCNLSLSTKRRGGLYAGCDDFSRDYAPPPPSGTDKA